MSSFNDTPTVEPWYLTLDLTSPTLGRQIMFITLITLLVPSLLCSIFLFTQFIQHRDLLWRSKNLAVICILIVSFLQSTTALPMSLVFLKTGRVANNSYWFCVLWEILDQSFSSIGIWLVAFGTVERYFLIFHRVVLQKYKIFLRFIPIGFCFLEPLCCFTVLTIFSPGCKNIFHPAYYLCGGACFNLDVRWVNLSTELNGTAPIGIVILGNIVLIFRVLHQKRRMQQARIWAKNKKMVLRLVSAVTICGIFWLPNTILIHIDVVAKVQLHDISYFLSNYGVYIQYFGSTLYPLIVCGALPEIRELVQATVRRRRQRIINTIEMNAMDGSRGK